MWSMRKLNASPWLCRPWRDWFFVRHQDFTLNCEQEVPMVERRYLLPASILSLVLAMGFTATGWSVDPVDHSLYAGLLKEHVQDGVVNYQGFKNEEAKLDAYLRLLEHTNSSVLLRNEQLAFYLNAYNAWTIKLVLGGYPGIKSIKDLGGLLSSPWKKEICRIDGRVISLDELEHKIIRPRFHDPRIHFAVNCASKSCPPLLSEPYSGSDLDRQLDAATRAFINDPRSNRLTGETLNASKIFDWYRADFKPGVVDFFLKYAEAEFRAHLEANKAQLRIEYLDYNWALNGK
jgi:hypothetical protein